MNQEWINEKKRLGQDQAVFIVAEIGANHDGDAEKARQLVDIAARCGADAVKFQTYTADELLADQDRIVEWGPPGNTVQEPVGEMFDRIHLPREEHLDLFLYAQQKGLIPFSTPFSMDGVHFLEGLGVSIYKVASSDVTHFPLLETLAKTKKPIILSTGKSTMEEVVEAVQLLKKNGVEHMALLHCVSAYPAPDEDCHLRVMSGLQEAFPGCIIGLSDHSIGTLAPCLAVALGARIIEKHITYNKSALGPDHYFSLDEQDLRQLVVDVRRSEVILGEKQKLVRPSEARGRVHGRPSLIAAKKILKGQKIVAEDIKICRPGTGMAPRFYEATIGRIAKTDINQNEPLLEEKLK